MFWDNFSRLCNQIHKSPNAVAKDLSISSGAITGWKKGRTPQNLQLQKIAEYFNVSIDELKKDRSIKISIRTQSDQEMLDRITECFDLCDGPRKAALCVKAEELAKETQNQVKQTS